MGKHGGHLLALARGIDERPVTPSHEPKSIGHETTFSEDVADPEVVRRTLLKLADAVAARLRKHGLRGKTVTLKFRDHDFVTETRAHTLRDATDEAGEIAAVSLRQLDRLETDGRRVRLVGISVSKLTDAEAPAQLALFRDTSKSERLSRARDALEERFGRGSVERASLLASKLHPLAPPPPRARGPGEEEEK
jgi:DNA polymerase-4